MGVQDLGYCSDWGVLSSFRLTDDSTGHGVAHVRRTSVEESICRLHPDILLGTILQDVFLHLYSPILLRSRRITVSRSGLCDRRWKCLMSDKSSTHVRDIERHWE